MIGTRLGVCAAMTMVVLPRPLPARQRPLALGQ
jgi:hypothetical protein